MKRKNWVSVLILGAVLLIAGEALYAAMTYDQAYYRNNRAYLGSGGSNDPLYNLWGTLEGLYEGSSNFDAIRLLESSGATYYTKLQAGDQSANLTWTLPTADGSNGQVLKTNGAGVLSWTANGGTFTGGAVTSDMTLSDGVDILLAHAVSDSNTAIQGYDNNGTAYVDAFRVTNGDTVAVVLGSATASLAISSTGMDVGTDGAVSGVSTLATSGAVTVGTTLGVGGTITLESGETIANTTNTEIAFSDGSEDFILDLDAGSNTVGLKSSTGVTALAMGTVDDLTGVGTIAFDAAAASLTTATSGDAQDLTLGITGVTNSSVILTSSGTAADALQITAAAGGIDISAAGASANEDIDISTSASINLTSTEADAAAIVLTSTGGIDLTSSATYDIDLTATGGKILATANENAAGAISLLTTGGGGTSETIVITNDQGTDAAAVGLTATAGGITLTAGDDVTGTITDDLILTATDDTTINGGSTGSILNLFTNNHANVMNIGTGTAGNTIHIADNDTTADSVTIGSAKDTIAVAGISVTVGSTGTTSATTIQSGTGDLALTSTDDIALTVNNTTTDNITLTNTPGTAADAIKVTATAGGIDIDAASGKILDIDAGTIQIDTKTAGAGAIALTANQGAADTITVTNTQGNTATAITLTSTAGGITLAASSGVTTGDPLYGDGTAASYGFLRAVVNDAEPHAVLVTESGKVLQPGK